MLVSHKNKFSISLLLIAGLFLTSCFDHSGVSVKKEASQDASVKAIILSGDMEIANSYTSGVAPKGFTMGEPVRTSLNSSVDYETGEIRYLEGDYVLLSPSYDMGVSSPVYVVEGGTVSDPATGGTIDAGAGILTAGEWFDHEHWADFRTFMTEYPDYFTEWQMDVQRRVILQFSDVNNKPLQDVDVEVKSDCQTSWTARTHNDGRVVFFLPSQQGACSASEISLKVNFSESHHEAVIPLTKDDDQEWTVQFPAERLLAARNLDLLFIVDVTGSMGDELTFFKEELLDILNQVQSSQSINNLRVGSIFYKDRGDDFVTRKFDFTSDFGAARDNFTTMEANGGGDWPESVNEALKVGMTEMEWTETNTVRLAFLIADAPPSYYQDEEYTYIQGVQDAMEKGIKIIPVAASGIDKSTEYLFRSIAVSTMGKYIFLTDDSGVGGSHIEADVGEFTVESLNDILIRTIVEEYQKGL
jgi:hypothetical protein